MRILFFLLFLNSFLFSEVTKKDFENESIVVKYSPTGYFRCFKRPDNVIIDETKFDGNCLHWRVNYDIPIYTVDGKNDCNSYLRSAYKVIDKKVGDKHLGSYRYIWTLETYECVPLCNLKNNEIYLYPNHPYVASGQRGGCWKCGDTKNYPDTLVPGLRVPEWIYANFEDNKCVGENLRDCPFVTYSKSRFECFCKAEGKGSYINNSFTQWAGDDSDGVGIISKGEGHLAKDGIFYSKKDGYLCSIECSKGSIGFKDNDICAKDLPKPLRDGNITSDHKPNKPNDITSNLPDTKPNQTPGSIGNGDGNLELGSDGMYHPKPNGNGSDGGANSNNGDNNSGNSSGDTNVDNSVDKGDTNIEVKPDQNSSGTNNYYKGKDYTKNFKDIYTILAKIEKNTRPDSIDSDGDGIPDNVDNNFSDGNNGEGNSTNLGDGNSSSLSLGDIEKFDNETNSLFDELKNDWLNFNSSFFENLKSLWSIKSEIESKSFKGLNSSVVDSCPLSFDFPLPNPVKVSIDLCKITYQIRDFLIFIWSIFFHIVFIRVGFSLLKFLI